MASTVHDRAGSTVPRVISVSVTPGWRVREVRLSGRSAGPSARWDCPAPRAVTAAPEPPGGAATAADVVQVRVATAATATAGAAHRRAGEVVMPPDGSRSGAVRRPEPVAHG